MRKSRVLLSLMLLVCIGTISLAADSDDLARENAELRQKLNQIDMELQGLKKTVMDQSDDSMDPLPRPVWSNLDIQLYGYLKLDAAYDSSRVINGNYAQWVESEGSNNDDDQFNMTANQSRFGMRINGPDDGAITTSGRAEVDFYGPGLGVKENQGRLMMRHAYIKLDWHEERFNIIAGQTSDVISPLLPSTVNYSVHWWTGNIGYRRPQIRLTKEYELTEQTDFKLEAALVRTIGRDTAFDTESGEDSGQPTVQVRTSLSLPLYGPERTTIGVSGHTGEEEYDTAADGTNTNFKTWSLNLDVTQPIKKWLSIKAELFTGENLDAYLGGIGQGVTVSGANQYEEIGSTGGWIAASLGPWNKTRFNVGGGIDDVDKGNVNIGDRTLNQSIFGNMFYAVNNNTEWALELSHWRTEYSGLSHGDALRIQTALIYKF